MTQTPTSTKTMILEITLISAQGLKIPNSITNHPLHTYTIAWVDPSTKLRSHRDRVGGENPTWNEKFIFRVSPEFISGDTSAVQFQISACGFIKDYLIGNVRFLLSSSSLVCSKSGHSGSGIVFGTPAFSALHIRRKSGRVNGVLNIAATVYESLDFVAFNGMSAVCFHDLIGKNENDEYRYPRSERRMSWHSQLKRVGSEKSERSSDDFSDGNESSESSLSSSVTVKDMDGEKLTGEVAGKKGLKSDGGRWMCGLRWFSLCPLDQSDLKEEDVGGI
ncbi:hypothetical protein QVD17_20596 [Tagetes erecta]|uniref:C2 domain-containing protein n=1 Tax=Tagetes erecta TaxID=13708 RepID=A0AAD8KLZ9_TARER|nr:hypothetical protein QVD17_20596 [Tagetes erecta]